MKKLDFLITGTGRCGSVYLARLLSSLGIACGHESIFGYKGIDWAERCLEGKEKIRNSYTSVRDTKDWILKKEVMAESSYLAAPFLSEPILNDVKIIHVVRNPIKVVNSFVNYIDYFRHNNTSKSKKDNQPYEEFIYKHVPELKQDMPTYDRACLYYIRWNRMIESKINSKDSIFHRIEDDIENILNFIGKKKCVNILNDKKVNTYEKTGESFDLKLIQDEQIKKDFIKIGEDYGYSMISKYLFI